MRLVNYDREIRKRTQNWLKDFRSFLQDIRDNAIIISSDFFERKVEKSSERMAAIKRRNIMKAIARKLKEENHE